MAQPTHTSSCAHLTLQSASSRSLIGIVVWGNESKAGGEPETALYPLHLCPHTGEHRVRWSATNVGEEDCAL